MNGTVTISGQRDSLVLLLPERGMPETVAFGSKARASLATAERSARTNGMDIAVPSAVLLPVGGMGCFGWPAIAGHRDGRDFTLEFSNWKFSGGRLTASDGIAKIDITIAISVSDGDVFQMNTTLTNRGDGPYTLDRCMAASFLVAEGACELTSFTGTWGREFQTRKELLGPGLWSQENRRGRTSHDRFPGVALNAGDATLAVHIGFSGNHIIAIDRLDDGRRLVHAGELFEPGEIRLAPGESYASPTAYAASDPETLAAFVQNRLIQWPGGKMRPRPVTLNTWEGNYFDHRMDSLKAQAAAAADLGIERFVLDDGWFGRRDDDTSSLGDWYIDARKYPDGLKPLVDHVTGLGMEFGLWFEPEMVNPDSDLHRVHPDWVLQVEGRPLLLSRHQLVLDLTRKEVSDYLFDCMDRILKAHAISYIKWDMNRDLTHVGGRDGRAMTGKQTRAVYALMDRVRHAHPNVEIESCASGGGRADYGALARTHRIWASDCTDALERLEIQRGAAMFLPNAVMGSHISASPNHQTHRRHTLAFRAIVALAYHFGVELNPLTLTPEERVELKSWIALHKRLRPLLHTPEARFHLDPVDGRHVWGAESADRITIFVAQGPQMVAEQPAPLTLDTRHAKPGTWRIVGQHPEKPDYIRVSAGQTKLLAGQVDFSLESVTAAGLPLPMLRPESGVVLELQRTKGA